MEGYIWFLGTNEKSRLDDRRGRFLEKLWAYNGPYNEKFKIYICKNEAQVYYGDTKISEKDIDIVYEEESNDNIELHECKSTASNSLREPISVKNKGKFDLMKNTMQIASINKVQCNSYIITYDTDKRKITHLLKKHEYDDFRIICGGDIVKNITNKLDKNWIWN